MALPARRRTRRTSTTRDRIEWYDAGLEQRLARRTDLERELAGAVSRHELDLAFQPVVDLRHRNPVGMEALLRWRHPGLGTVAPAELVPVAEDLGVIGDIDGWVLGAACRHLAGWLSAGSDLWLAVNVAPAQVVGPEFAARVRDALLTHRIAPERLVIELAEARLPADLNAVAAGLAELRAPRRTHRARRLRRRPSASRPTWKTTAPRRSSATGPARRRDQGIAATTRRQALAPIP